MGGARINHVSVNATDLERSEAFYVDLFGAEPIPTPQFGFPVRWLAVGDTQLHLFFREVEPPSNHHFAIEVDDLAAVYRRAAELGIFERDLFDHHLIELPGDQAQLYIRDPAGNLVEIDAAGASRLPDDVRADMKVLADFRPQDGDHARARLFIGDDRRAPEPVS